MSLTPLYCTPQVKRCIKKANPALFERYERMLLQDHLAQCEDCRWACARTRALSLRVEAQQFVLISSNESHSKRYLAFTL